MLPPANRFLILSRKNKRLVNYSIVLHNQRVVKWNEEWRQTKMSKL